MKNPRAKLFLEVFVIALVLRLVFAVQWSTLPYAQTPYLDALSYDRWARAIASGHWLRGLAFYQSPLYPYFLALVYKIAGPSAFMISCLQAVIDAVTCGLLSLIAARAFGRVAGVATGLMAALYAPMIFFSAPLMKEGLGLFALTLFVYLWQLAMESPRRRDFLGAGVALGLAVLIRSNALLLGLCAFVMALLFLRRRAWPGLAWFSLAIMLTILPATAHNFWVSRDFVLVNYGGGFNFYVGHWREATGANAYPPEVSTDPSQEESDVTRIATDEAHLLLKPSEVSDFWFHKGLEVALDNPTQELALLVNKTMLFWNGYEPPDNYDLTFIRGQFRTLLSWPLLGFAPLALLAIFGSVLVFKENRFARFLVAMTATYFASVVLFYVTDRYRLPVVVFLLPLAGAALPSTWKVVRARGWILLAIAGLLTAPFAWLGFHNFSNASLLDSYNWGLVSSMYADAKQDQEAVQAIEKAQSAKPYGVTAQALIKAADSYERLGRLSDAERILLSSTEIYPKDGLTYHNLGRFFHDHARFDEARKWFTKSIEVAPWNYQPYVGLALTDAKLKKFGEAAWAVQQGERIAVDQYDWQKLNEAIKPSGP